MPREDTDVAVREDAWQDVRAGVSVVLGDRDAYAKETDMNHWWTWTCVGLGLLAVAVPWLRAARCRLGWHGDVLLTQKRDPVTGREVRPHVLVWECQRCYRPAYESVVETSWLLQLELREQKRSSRQRTALRVVRR